MGKCDPFFGITSVGRSKISPAPTCYNCMSAAVVHVEHKDLPDSYYCRNCAVHDKRIVGFLKEVQRNCGEEDKPLFAFLDEPQIPTHEVIGFDRESKTITIAEISRTRDQAYADVVACGRDGIECCVAVDIFAMTDTKAPNAIRMSVKASDDPADWPHQARALVLELDRYREQLRVAGLKI